MDTLLQKTMKTRDMQNQTEFLQDSITTDFLSDGPEKPYRTIRFYTPIIGRWMTRDPLGEAGGINLYGVANNSPVNYIDPWGLEVVLPPEATKAYQKVIGIWNDLIKGSWLPGFAKEFLYTDLESEMTGSFLGCTGVTKLSPIPKAGAHSVFKRSSVTGRISGYIEYDEAGRAIKRFRGEGRPHGGMEPPIILEPKPGKGPGSPPKVPRKPLPGEIPSGY